MPLITNEYIENIENIKKSIDKWSLAHPWKISLLDRKVEWWEALETERKKKVDDLNYHLESLLTAEDYEEAFQCLDEAREYLEDEDQVIFSPDKYREIQALKEKINTAKEKNDIPSYTELINALVSLNPYSRSVKEELRYLEHYWKLDRELNGKDVYQINSDIKEIDKKISELPQFLHVPLREKIDSMYRSEIDSLWKKALAKEKEGKLNMAVEALSRARRIASDPNKILSIDDRIKKLETKIKRKNRAKFTFTVTAVIVIITVYLILTAIEKSKNKKELYRNLNEIQTLLANDQFDMIKKRLGNIFPLRDKLKKDSAVDRDIKETLGRIYMKMSKPPDDRKNDVGEMIKRSDAARQFFENIPPDFSSEWVRKALNIYNAANDFKQYMKFQDSGKALMELVKLKRLYGEDEEPFKLLPLVSYRNYYGHREVKLEEIRFVFMRGGRFDMGCFAAFDSQILDDAPVKTKALSDFWISISEITRDSYTGRHNSFLPQADVTWGEANTYAENFGKKFRLNTGLPTEAQWEYAARSGGKNIEYPWGDGISCLKANYWDCGNRVKAATVFFPNSSGIYDMAGNLREWCRDAYDAQAYFNTAYKDPYVSSGDSGRVVRGGSYADGPLALKTYTRYFRDESQKDAFTGFRIVIQDGK